MREESDRKNAALDELEQAAEEVTEPEEIQERAKAKAKAPALISRLGQFIPYALAAVLIGAGMMLVAWRPPRNPALAEKIQRYLIGALGITGVFGFAKVLEVFVITRVRTASCRFN